MVVSLHDGSVGVYRVSLALDPYDVDLLDRMATLSGSNRSEQLRSILGELRPMLEATVEALEGAVRARDALDQAAATASLEHIAAILPRAERMQREYLGAMAELEGLAASDPPPSNQGGHKSPTSDGLGS